jgi:hypothetical protein
LWFRNWLRVSGGLSLPGRRVFIYWWLPIGWGVLHILVSVVILVRKCSFSGWKALGLCSKDWAWKGGKKRSTRTQILQEYEPEVACTGSKSNRNWSETALDRDRIRTGSEPDRNRMETGSKRPGSRLWVPD